MLISIITPYRDRLELLNETIDSVIQQTAQNWELLLINDHSSKSTIEFLNQKIINHPKIKLLSTDKRFGAGAARNLGIRTASGDYLIFLDSDDILLPYAIEQRTQAIKNHQDFDVLIFNVKKIPHNQIKQINFNDTEQISSLENWNSVNSNPLKQFLKLNSAWQTSAGTWKKSWLLDKNVFFDENLRIWQDVDFHINALLNNPKLKILTHQYPADVLYRQHPDTLSQRGYPFPYRKSQLYFFKKYLNLLKATPHEKIFKTTYLNFLDKLINKHDKRLKLFIFATMYPVPLKYRLKALKTLFKQL